MGMERTFVNQANHEKTAGNMFGNQARIPGSIRELLKLLVDENVKIILENGDEECVEVVAVIGDLLVAKEKHDCCEIKFVDIDCICVVKVECEEILESILNEVKRHC